MRILLTNDDGLDAPGIEALHDALIAPPALGEVLAIAPRTVQSATSHGITFHAPLMCEEVVVNDRMTGIAVDGRPADCVKVALRAIWQERFGPGSLPDLTISGMNSGANVGINVIYYYGATLWQLAGFTEDQSLQINIVSGAVSIAACFITIAVIDKIGRKPLLLIGSAGMAATLFAMVYAFANGTLDAGGNLQLSSNLGTIALVAANLYVIFFNVSWGPVMWVMLGEMFPNQIRGSGLAVAGLAQWSANFLITWTFPMLLTGIGLAGAYGLYTLAAAISVLFVLKYVHETKGRELEQMEG